MAADAGRCCRENDKSRDCSTKGMEEGNSGFDGAVGFEDGDFFFELVDDFLEREHAKPS